LRAPPPVMGGRRSVRCVRAYRDGEDGEGGAALHGPGGVGHGGVDEADEGEPLPHLQRVAHEHHPLPPQLLQHRRRVKPADPNA